MTRWLRAVDWRHVFEIAAGVTTAIFMVAGFVFAVGVDRTNVGRDVEGNAIEIRRNRGDIDQHTRQIEANRSEMQAQRAVLSRIEEGVEWIKKDLERTK